MAKSPGANNCRDKPPLGIVSVEGVQSLDDLIRSRSVAKKGRACTEARLAAAIAPTRTTVVLPYHGYGGGASAFHLFQSPDCAIFHDPALDTTLLNFAQVHARIAR